MFVIKFCLLSFIYFIVIVFVLFFGYIEVEDDIKLIWYNNRDDFEDLEEREGMICLLFFIFDDEE